MNIIISFISFIHLSVLANISIAGPQDITFEQNEDYGGIDQKAILPPPQGPRKPCVDPINRRGICLKLQSCPEILRRASQISDGDNLRFLQKSLCGYFGANSIGYYCCATQSPIVPNFTPPGVITPTPIPKAPIKPEDLEFSNGHLLTAKDGTLAIRPTSPTLNSRWCGYSNFTSTRIVGGREAQIGAWPWSALLKDGASGFFYCGGALITNHHVLTAAHCVNEITTKTLQVRLREHNITSKEDGPELDIEVNRIILHPEFDPNLNANDIAILELKEAVYFTERVRPICVPKSLLWKNRNVNGLRGTIIGWGRQNYNDVFQSEVLKEADITIQPQDVCEKAYSRFKNINITDKAFCAGDMKGSADACQGDSGGPLMMPSKDRYHVIGIVSSGYRCGEPGFPGIYTRVQRYHSWIQQTVDYQDDDAAERKARKLGDSTIENS